MQLALGQARLLGLARDAVPSPPGRRGGGDRVAPSESLVARNVSEYVAIATRLGQDAVFRDATRRRISARKHRLFDVRGVAEEWASFIARAVDLSQVT